MFLAVFVKLKKSLGESKQKKSTTLEDYHNNLSSTKTLQDHRRRQDLSTYDIFVKGDNRI